MTRDTKLALVVGFALVLAVGVLISDHFASGYQTPPADLVETQPAVHVRDVINADRPRPYDQASSEGRERPNRRQARNQAQIPQSPDIDPQADPRELAGVTTPPKEILLGNPDFHENIRSGPNRELLPHERDLGQGIILPLIDTRDDRDIRADLSSEASQPARTKPSLDPKPEPRWHIVADGDSLWEIAKYYYGKGSLWQKLAKENQGRISKEGVVRTGVRLLIPQPKAMGLPDRKLPDAPSTKVPNKTPAQAPAKTNHPKSDSKTANRSYTVGKDETLSEIASKQLGSAKRMGEIIKLNDIEDADAIRAGMVLRLPK